MDVISMNDGTNEFVADLRDFTDLVDKYMGMDARRWMEGFLTDVLENFKYEEDLLKEIDDMKEHQESVIKSIRSHIEKLSELIGAKELDRREISNTVGAIGLITWREMNR